MLLAKERTILPSYVPVSEVLKPAETRRLPKAERTLTNRQRTELTRQHRQTIDVSGVVFDAVVDGRSGVSLDGNRDLQNLAANSGVDIDRQKPVIAARPDLQQALDKGRVVLLDMYGYAASAPSYRNSAKK